jgi:hypothetical protein
VAALCERLARECAGEAAASQALVERLAREFDRARRSLEAAAGAGA